MVDLGGSDWRRMVRGVSGSRGLGRGVVGERGEEKKRSGANFFQGDFN